MSEKDKAYKKRPLLPQMLCGLMLCFTIFIFAPVEMVTINSTNFWFEISDFIGLFALLFAVALIAVEIVYLIFRKLPYAVWLLSLAALFGVALGVYIQGTYLCLGDAALTAGAPDWSSMLAQMLINTAIWLVLIGVSAVFSLVKPKVFLKIVPAVCALILVMESTALVSLFLQKNDTGDLNSIYCSDVDKFTVSDNGDVIVVMLDTLDATLTDRMIEEDPQYAKVFEDFTYYRNTSSSYSLSDTSFASFMTGELCYNEEPFFEYVRRAFAESRFIPTMIENGMTVQVYAAPMGMFGKAQLEQVSNLRVRDSYIGNKILFACNMISMLGYRYAPKAMQPFLFRDFVAAFDREQVPAKDKEREATFKNLIFRQELLEQGVTLDKSRRFFKLYMLEGAHRPTEMDRNAQRCKTGDQYEQALGCFVIMQELFDELKAVGAYDKATIIVMADHGLNTARWDGICSPSLLVKYPGESGDGMMRISNAPTTLLDMRATALYGAGLPYEECGTPVHLWEGVTERERTFMDYRYETPSSWKFYVNTMTEYIVPKDATDADSYVPSGRVFEKPQ